MTMSWKRRQPAGELHHELRRLERVFKRTGNPFAMAVLSNALGIVKTSFRSGRSGRTSFVRCLAQSYVRFRRTQGRPDRLTVSTP